MKKIQLFYSILILFTCGSLAAYAQQYSGNESKTRNENVVWRSAIEKWNTTVKSWGDNRSAFHENKHGLRVDRDREYCSEKGCWSEDMFELSFAGKGGSRESWTVQKRRPDAEVTDMSGNTWESVNSGQSLVYSGANGERWESINSGQVIEYQNARGDKWESTNVGQGIIFTGADGRHWESVNDGQSMEYREDDMEWESANSGQSESYRDEDEEWEGSFN